MSDDKDITKDAPQEPVIEEPTKEPVETRAEPQVDVEQLREDITKEIETSVSEKVSQGIVERIGKALGLTKEEEEKLPSDPKQLKAMIEDIATNKAESLLTEKEQREQEEKEQQEAETNQRSESFANLWRRQYDELAQAGKVPKIEKEDKSDPGVMARARILTKLSEVLQQNQANGVDYVPTLKEVFYDYPDVSTTHTTAGANAPVSGNGRAHATTQGMSYEDLHKASFEQIAKQGLN